MPVRTESNPSRASRSLVTTLAIAFVMLSVIPLLLVSGLLGYFDFQSQREALLYRQQLIAAEAATKVSGFIEQIFSVLEAGARVGQVSDQEQQRLILEKLLGFEDALREVVLVNKEGGEIASVSRHSLIAASSLLKLDESDWFAQVSQDQRFISAIYIDETTSEPLIILAVPAKDVFGDFQGALVAEVNLKFMWDVVDQLQVGQTGQAYVVNKRGDLIAFGDTARVLRGENLSQLSQVAEFIGGADEDEFEFYSTGINGSAVTAAFVPLGTPDWAVITEIPVEEAYQEAISHGGYLLGSFLVIAILAAGIGVYASRYLTNPLLNLTQTATQVAAGEIELQATLEGPAEVVRLASSFNDMTRQLQELIGSLEERVAERTRRLETIAVLSEQLTAILDFEQLLQKLANEIKEKFAYYHAHVYMIDDQGQNLMLAAGVGEAGAQMKARGHHIPLGAPTSLVARAARTGEIVWVDNVREAPDWLPNPLLPDTRSEMAVPIILDGNVVGVLDVQQDQIAGLDEADASLLRSLANQVAIAIRNARQFTQTQTALVEAQRLQRLYLGQTWEHLLITRPTTDYEFRRPSMPPLQDIMTPEVEAALQREQTVILGSPIRDYESDDIDKNKSLNPNPQPATPSALATPLKLHNQVIGVLGFHDEKSNRHWTEDEIALIEAVSEQMALAIENARLFETTDRQATREKIIADTTRRIWASGEMEQVMQIAAKQLGITLDASKVIIRLGTEEQLVRETGYSK